METLSAVAEVETNEICVRESSCKSNMIDLTSGLLWLFLSGLHVTFTLQHF